MQAGRVLSELTLAYEYAIGLEQFPANFSNPALLAKMSIKQSRLKVTCKKGTRVLNDQELKRVWILEFVESIVDKRTIKRKYSEIVLVDKSSKIWTLNNERRRKSHIFQR